MKINPEIIITEDGTQTLQHPVLGDLYHSTRGAVGEAMHVYIKNGLLRAEPLDGGLRILEVGFGSGLNAWLTMEHGCTMGLRIDYTAIELYPIDKETIAQLTYTCNPLFARMHDTPWGEKCNISEGFVLKKIEVDLVDTIFDTTFDLIYFDAFAPDTQSELWSTAIFSKMYDALHKNGALVTYSAKGDVKRAMREAGFSVHRIEGALGKRHMIRAVK